MNADAEVDDRRSILFLCPYGGAKSVIAASYFNRLATEQSLPYAGQAAAAEEPYKAVPEPVVALLSDEGVDVRTFKPRRVDTAELHAAAKVISIDCDLSGVDADGITIEHWDDVPKVSVDLTGSASAIRQHVEALVAELRSASA